MERPLSRAAAIFAVVMWMGGCVGDDPIATSPTPTDGGPPCQPGAKRCVGAVPRVCDDSGRFVDNPACTGLAPICSGGACVAFRVRGTIGTLGPPPAPAQLRVGDNGFEAQPRMCNANVCVRGGLLP